MLWKRCTQNVSKFGKLSSGHRTGKRQFSFQSQRKAMPKNAQITAQLHSSHMLVKSCSKFSKPGFNNTWTENSQMDKLGLEKAEESKIKLPTFAESQRKQDNSRKISASLTMWKPLTMWKILQEMGISDHLTCLLRNLYTGQEATVRTAHRKQTGSKLGQKYLKSVYSHPACLFIHGIHHVKYRAGWITS